MVELKTTIWNNSVNAFLNPYKVEINLPPWSGRQCPAEALEGIALLCKFLVETAAVIRSQMEVPDATESQPVASVIKEGLLTGHVAAVVRPDGKIGYAITPAGKALLEPQELETAI